MKNRQNKIKEFIIDTVIFIVGGAFCSVSVNCFLSRNNILNGGFTGIATILFYLFSAPIGTVIFILNIPVFILAYKKLGKSFVLRTAWATLIMSVLIDLGAILPTYSNDLLLCSLFGGALTGFGLGIVFIRNATTGGVDIIAKLIQLKYPQISIGKSFLIFDAAVIVIGGFVYGNFESVLYAAVVIFVSSQVLDYVIYGIGRGAMIMIITEKGDKIRKKIIRDFDRGVTIIKARGGYSDTDKDVLICACYDNRTQKFLKEIKSIDENAFMIVSQSKQILGRGFLNT